MPTIEFGVSATRVVAEQKSVGTDPVCNFTTSRLKSGPRNGGAEVFGCPDAAPSNIKEKDGLITEVSFQRRRCPKRWKSVINDATLLYQHFFNS
jgi:hypothetical protein